MFHHWLIITFSLFGTGSLQYINTGGPGADIVLNPLDATIMQHPLPNINYMNLAHTHDDSPSEIDVIGNWEFLSNLANRGGAAFETGAKRSFSPWGGKRDSGMSSHIWDWRRAGIPKPSTPKPPRFSPWSGGRTNEEQTTTSPPGVSSLGDISTNDDKAKDPKEPSTADNRRANYHTTKAHGLAPCGTCQSLHVDGTEMSGTPLSPWSGRVVGPLIYTPNFKSPKIIFSTSVPELTRIVSNHAPNEGALNMASFHFIPHMDKRHPIKVLTLSTNGRPIKEALPYNSFVDSLPMNFRLGHPYHNVVLKKDGKRKVKFSAWGGKRSPPIIGPIWTHAPDAIKESTLNTILLIRQGMGDKHLYDVMNRHGMKPMVARQGFEDDDEEMYDVRDRRDMKPMVARQDLEDYEEYDEELDRDGLKSIKNKQ